MDINGYQEKPMFVCVLNVKAHTGTKRKQKITKPTPNRLKGIHLTPEEIIDLVRPLVSPDDYISVDMEFESHGDNHPVKIDYRLYICPPGENGEFIHSDSIQKLYDWSRHCTKVNN